MQPNGMIFWDWNGTLMDDVDFTHGCLNWMLESHGYPQRYDLAQYRELFRFPIEDYYRLAGFDFSRHPYPMLAEHFMAHYNAGVDACPVMAHAVDTLTELARRGWKQAVLSASRRDYLIEQVAARGLQGFFTELLGLADIYGVSKVQLGTDYLRRHYQGWLTTDADFRYTVADFDNISREGIADMLYNRGMQILQAKEVRYGAPLMRELERICLLKCVDRQWMDHIDNMDQLRQGIALRGYGQKDPVVEYRIEGFDMFDQMVDSIREDSVKMLLTIEIRQAGAAPKREQVAKPTGEGFVPGNGAPGVKGAPKGQPVRVIKIGRNDPCPCGSGLKWKKCTCAKFHPEGLPTDANED